jgi:hypothetical protein
MTSLLPPVTSLLLTCDDTGAPDVGRVGDAHEQEVPLSLLLAVERLRVHRDLDLQLLLPLLVHAALLHQVIEQGYENMLLCCTR